MPEHYHDDTVPASQQRAMLKHLSDAKREAARRYRGARTHHERMRAENDMTGAEIMENRVRKEWNVR